jgi:hypothetical protein
VLFLMWLLEGARCIIKKKKEKRSEVDYQCERDQASPERRMEHARRFVIPPGQRHPPFSLLKRSSSSWGSTQAALSEAGPHGRVAAARSMGSDRLGPMMDGPGPGCAGRGVLDGRETFLGRRRASWLPRFRYPSDGR